MPCSTTKRSSTGNEAYEAGLYDRSLSSWERAKLKNRFSLGLLNSGQALIVAGGVTAMMWLAASEVSNGTRSLGDLVAVNAFMIQLFIPLNMLGFVYRELKAALADIDTLFGLLAQRPQITDRPSARDLPSGEHCIEFRHLYFSYQPDRPILQDVSFSVGSGEKVALVGYSGSGKSTLARLLFRFYDVDQGAVLVDGIDVRDWSQHSLRREIGVVPQDTVLFNDSLLHNLRYGQPEASDEQVRAAVQFAQLDGFIERLPKGWHTEVGERGLKLSGGEKQRVAIARVLLKQPGILVFDEATSSLDSTAERAITEAMRRLSRDHTTLVIAHRLSTVADADRIVVLDAGRVVEQGTHTALLALGGRYAELWRAQQAEAQEAAAERSGAEQQAAGIEASGRR